MTHSVQIGCDIASSQSAIALAHKYEHFYATVGFHPVDAQDPNTQKVRSSESEISLPQNPEDIYEAMRNLIIDNRAQIVAI